MNSIELQEAKILFEKGRDFYEKGLKLIDKMLDKNDGAGIVPALPKGKKPIPTGELNRRIALRNSRLSNAK